MAETSNIEWPREIWMAEREDHDQGVVSAVLSEHATVSRWDGDKEREREFHRYVDGDTYDSLGRYCAHRIETVHADLAAAITALSEEEHKRGQVEAERDAARAEVERLLGVLQSLVAAYDEPNNGRYIRWEIDEARAALSTKGDP